MNLTDKATNDMQPDNSGGKDSWFERNPKLTIFFLFLLILVPLTYITEKFLAAQNPFKQGVKRCIRLKEHTPFSVLKYNLAENEQKYDFDSIEEKEYVIQADKDGFIMPSQIHDQPDLTIAFIGASTTECFFVDEEKRFPYLTGRLLEQTSRLKINSINSGMSGNNSLHSLNILLNKVIPCKPGIVVLLHNMNDLGILYNEGTYWNKNPFRSPLVTISPDIRKNLLELKDLLIPNVSYRLENAVKRLIFGKKQVDEFKDARDIPKLNDQEFLAEEFSMNLETFIAICQARKIIPVLMTMANRFKPDPDPFIWDNQSRNLRDSGISYYNYKNLFDKFNEIIRDVGNKNYIHVIDLAKKIPQTRENMYDTVHFNNQGSQNVAHIVSTELLPLILSARKPQLKKGVREPMSMNVP